MPWLDIPGRSMSMFYVINAPVSISTHTDAEAPKSNPLDPAKPNLVLLHAGTSSSAAFSLQMGDARLKSAFNLIAIDTAFCGRTEAAHREKHEIEDSAICLVSVLDQLELPAYSIVGEGFIGANSAAWIALKRPDKIQSICLVSPGWLKEPEGTVRALLDEWLPGACSNKEGKGDGTGSVPAIVTADYGAYWFGAVSREVERRAVFCDAFEQRYGIGQDSHDITHCMRFFAREPIPKELLATITVPILILQGSDDLLTSPIEAAEEWKAQLTGARGGADLRVIQGAPHLLMFTDASVANRFVFAFVKRSIGA